MSQHSSIRGVFSLKRRGVSLLLRDEERRRGGESSSSAFFFPVTHRERRVSPEEAVEDGESGREEGLKKECS